MKTKSRMRFMNLSIWESLAGAFFLESASLVSGPL